MPGRVVFAETWNDAEVLPAMEEGLRTRGLAAVVGEVSRLGLSASRRLPQSRGDEARGGGRDQREPVANERADRGTPSLPAAPSSTSAIKVATRNFR